MILRDEIRLSAKNLPFFFVRSSLCACLAVVTSSQTSVAQNAAVEFQKGAGQFCLSTLTAQEQSQRYSNIMALGASFTHGCMACDWNRTWQGYTELTDDQFWVRRNFLPYFLKNSDWKQPQEFQFEQVYILENDGKTKPDGLVDMTLMSREGYPGEWLLDFQSGAFGWLSRNLKSQIASHDPELMSEALKVGGPFVQKGQLRVRNDTREKGVLLRTVPGTYASVGAIPKSIYDLSLDGSFLIDQFEVYSDLALVKALEKTGWQDASLREQVIDSMVRRLASYNPSIVLALDLLFWDTVFEAIYRLHETEPRSPLVRLALAILERSPIGNQVFDQRRRQNQRDDLLQVLARLSRGVDGSKPVPVLLARLADNPLSKFRDSHYMPVLAALFGQFAEQVTGLDLTRELLFWLNKIAVIQGVQEHRMGDAILSRKLRLDELGLELDEADLRLLQQTFTEIAGTIPQLDESELDSTMTERFSSNPSSMTLKDVQFSYDPVGGSQVTMIPKFLSGLVGQVLLRALSEIPDFISGMNESFLHVNSLVDQLHQASDNNVHQLDVNEFYENLAYFINPRTAHPSVLGAKRMARMVEKTICGKKSL